jgi:hypothetical protein
MATKETSTSSVLRERNATQAMTLGRLGRFSGALRLRIPGMARLAAATQASARRPLR